MSTSGVPSQQRQLRAASDPGHPCPVRRPIVRRITDSVLSQGSLDAAVECVGDPSTPSFGALLRTNTRIQTGDSPQSDSSTQASILQPSSASPVPFSVHSRTSSRQGTSLGTQHDPLNKDLPSLPVMPIAQPPDFEGDPGYAPGYSAHAQHRFPAGSRSNLTRQTSHHSSHRRQPSGQHEASTQSTHHTHHTSRARSNSGTHGVVHLSHSHRPRSRSRSRPPSPVPHRYPSTSGRPDDDRKHYAVYKPSPDRQTSADRGEVDHHVLTRTHTRTSLHQPHPSTVVETIRTHSPHKLQEPHHHIDPGHISDVHSMPGLHSNMGNGTQTRYVRMLLALDDIPELYKLLASFFTWLLLAGFILFPGTFASWKDQPAGSTANQIAAIINNVPLLVIAWLCTGIGSCGMIWLWWRWHDNYIWIVNRIFVPGLLNSLAGVISTLTNVYGTQGGFFSTTAESTIIITGVITIICGILVLVYQFGMIRNLRKEHEAVVGVEKAGKYGEGVLGEAKREV